MRIALVTTLPSLSENKRIAEEVQALGYEFELVDAAGFSFVTADGVLNVPGLYDLQAEVIIVRGIFNALKPISTIIGSLRAKGARVFDNNFLEHKYSIDKVTDIIKLALAGVPVPGTVYLRDFESMYAKAREMGFPTVLKSTRMGKGASVFKLDSEAQLKDLLAGLEAGGKEAKSYLLQKYIDYKYDLRCLVIGEHIYTMKRIPASGEFRANFSLGGTVELFYLDEEGQELAKKALSVVGMSVGGVDILVGKDGKRYVLEVNHTAGFVGMEKATGENIGRVFVEHAISCAR